MLLLTESGVFYVSMFIICVFLAGRNSEIVGFVSCCNSSNELARARIFMLIKAEIAHGKNKNRQGLLDRSIVYSLSLQLLNGFTL